MVHLAAAAINYPQTWRFLSFLAHSDMWPCGAWCWGAPVLQVRAAKVAGDGGTPLTPCSHLGTRCIRLHDSSYKHSHTASSMMHLSCNAGTCKGGIGRMGALLFKWVAGLQWCRLGAVTPCIAKLRAHHGLSPAAGTSPMRSGSTWERSGAQPALGVTTVHPSMAAPHSVLTGPVLV